MKNITIWLLLTTYITLNQSIISQSVKVTITKETFGDIMFGVNQLGADTNFDGTVDIETPTDYPGYVRHFDYDFIQYISDLGYSGFTSKNGHLISGSSDSSFQINNYIGDNNQPWQGNSGNMKCHITPSYRYNGSWDTIIYSDIDISQYGGNLDSIAIWFGICKRAHTPSNVDNAGLILQLRYDNGMWLNIDTSLFRGLLIGEWMYAQISVPVTGDIQTASKVDILFACVNSTTGNQFGLDDISLVGWGENLPTLESVEIISLSGQSVITSEGGTLNFGTNVYPKNIPDTTVIWSVEEISGCATIDPVTGILMAIGNGNVNVIATANNVTNVESMFEVTITGQNQLVSDITVNSSSSVIDNAPGTMQMYAEVTPHCANDTSVTWYVNDESIATIDQNGLLTAISMGVVEVQSFSNDGSGVYGSKSVLVNYSPDIYVENIYIYNWSYSDEININDGILQFYADCTPYYSTDQTVTWKVNNISGYAIINEYGLLTAVSNGIVYVVATANDNGHVKDSVSILISNQGNLVNEINVISKSGRNELLFAGDTIQLKAIVEPLNAENKLVTWSVWNLTGAATISSDGLLTAQSEGKVRPTATAQDGSNVSDDMLINITFSSRIEDSYMDKILISPNPVNDLLIVNSNISITSLIVYDLNGKKHELEFDKLGNKYVINTEFLQNGMYLLQITTNDHKIYKENFLKN